MPDDIIIMAGDVGLQFLIEIDDANNPGDVVDLSRYGNFTIYFKKPDKTLLTVTGILYTTGEDGLIYYVSRPGQLDLEGRWSIQVSYTYKNSKIYTNRDTFMVVADLDEEE